MPFNLNSGYLKRSGLLLISVLICSGHASAFTFEPLGQKRTVAISGQINSFNFETFENQAASYDGSDQSLPDGWDPLRLGMDISVPDSSCFGQGVAMQSLTAGGARIAFSGLADVNIAGFPSYPFGVNGEGSASISMEYRFRVAEAQQIDLVMDSSIGSFNEDGFTFLLKSDSGQPVWAEVGVIDESGTATRSFKRRLNLQPGDYTISAQLQAISYLQDSNSVAGRTWAEFSVTAVPEPAAVNLMAGGIATLAALISRSRRRS